MIQSSECFTSLTGYSFSSFLCPFEINGNNLFLQIQNLHSSDKLAITSGFCLCACLPACLWITTQFPQCLLKSSNWETADHLQRCWEVHPWVPHGSYTVLQQCMEVVSAFPWCIFMLRWTDILSWSCRRWKTERKWGNLHLAGLIQTSGRAVLACYL